MPPVPNCLKVNDGIKMKDKKLLLKVVSHTGFEPVTSCVSGKRSKPTELMTLIFIKPINIDYKTKIQNFI